MQAQKAVDVTSDAFGGDGTTAPIRSAVVGAGYWGPNLVRVLHELPQTEVVYACDTRRSALAKIQRRYPSVATTTRFEKVIADESIELVAVATPVRSHFELVSAAIQAGKHVFVEKPMAASLAEAVELARLAEQHGVVLMPGHTFVYSPPVGVIRDLIHAGDLGEIYFISMSRVNLGLHQPDVGVGWDLGPHDFSILRYWLEQMPVRVSATSRACIIEGLPDVAFINLEYPSGTLAHVELSWLAPSKLRRTAIVGSQKMVVYDDTSNEPVRIFDSGVVPPDPQTFAEFRLSYRAGAVVSPRIEAVEPLAVELSELVSAILNGTPMRSTPQLGIEIVRMCEAVDRSLEENGHPVELDYVREAGALVDDD